jgi:hypothetical protein
VLEEFHIRTHLKSLNGLEDFPGLKSLLTSSCDDITALLAYAAKRGECISCDSYFDSRHLVNVIRYSFGHDKGS